MPLTLITGRANAGKSGLLYDPLVAAARRGDEAVLLLPTHPEVVRARAEFSSKAPVGLTVATLESWTQSLWALHGDGRAIVDPFTRDAAVRSVLIDAGPALSASARFTGFARLVADLCARTGGLDLHAGQGDASVRDVVLLVEAYRARVAEWGHVELNEAYVALATNNVQVDAVVSVNRFTDFSAQQLRFLSMLARHTEVRLALTYEESAPATRGLSPLIHRLRTEGATVVHCEGSPPRDELEHVDRALFTGRRVKSTGSVVFGEANGPEAETALIAEHVAGLVEEGIEPGRIAIVFRSFAGRWQAVEAALSAAGIPVDLDVSLPIAGTAYGRAFRNLIAIAGRGAGQRHEMLLFLQGPFSDAAPDAVRRLDRSWRRGRVDDGATLIRDARSVGGSASLLLSLADTVAKAPRDPQRVRRLADALIEARRPEERSESEARLDAAAHHVVCRGIDALSALPDGYELPTFYAALENATVASGSSERRGAVTVTEAHRVRGRRFDAVIVGGMTAEEFSAEHREPLAATLLCRMGQTSGTEERLAERLLFYTIASRPRQRLVLVRQASNSTGEPTRPSVFWDECMDLYRESPDAPVDAPVVSLGLTDPDRSMPTFTERRREARRLAFDGRLAVPAVERGVLAAPVVGPDDELSATELETYLSCPYRWFYDRMIRPRAIDRALDARELGSVTHALISRTYRRLREQGVQRVTPEVYQQYRMALDEEAAALRQEHFALVGLSEELGWAGAVTKVTAMLEQDQEFLSRFRPVHEEWQFGREVNRPFTVAGVPLRGFVDRVDRGPDGVIVTDYKSGKVKGYSSWLSENLLQPVVYALAAAQYTDEPVAAALYRSFADRTVRGFWNRDIAEPESIVKRTDQGDSAAWAELVEWVSGAVSDASDRMRQGHIGRTPSPRSCAYCGARDFCDERV